MKWLSKFWPSSPGAEVNHTAEVTPATQNQTRRDLWWTWNKEFRHAHAVISGDGIRPQFVYKDNTVIPSQEFPTNEAMPFPTPLKKDS